MRGERENLYFVDKRKLKRGMRFGPEPIPTPLQRLRHWIGEMTAVRSLRTTAPDALKPQPLTFGEKSLAKEAK